MCSVAFWQEAMWEIERKWRCTDGDIEDDVYWYWTGGKKQQKFRSFKSAKGLGRYGLIGAGSGTEGCR